MPNNLVVEIDPFHTRKEAEDIVASAKRERFAGVVVKGSQGSRWVNPEAGHVLSEAEFEGVGSGWLHYAEPGANDPDTEAVALLGAIGSTPLSLGIWVELDDLQGMAMTEASEWVSSLIKSCSTPQRPVAVLYDPERNGTVTSLPPGTREILWKVPELVYRPFWASRWNKWAGMEESIVPVAYELVSTRGLVPSVVAPSTTIPPRPHALTVLSDEEPTAGHLPEPEEEETTVPAPEEDETDDEDEAEDASES
jgi:hypothetical protein